jgi:hypothetical protein
MLLHLASWWSSIVVLCGYLGPLDLAPPNVMKMSLCHYVQNLWTLMHFDSLLSLSTQALKLFTPSSKITLFSLFRPLITQSFVHCLFDDSKHKNSHLVGLMLKNTWKKLCFHLGSHLWTSMNKHEQKLKLKTNFVFMPKSMQRQVNFICNFSIPCSFHPLFGPN